MIFTKNEGNRHWNWFLGQNFLPVKKKNITFLKNRIVLILGQTAKINENCVYLEKCIFSRHFIT